MRKKSIKKKETRLAVDVGARSVKAIELVCEGASERLAKVHLEQADSPQTKDKALVALKLCLDKLQPSVKDVRISLSAPNAIVRFINMPKMKEEDLKNSLRFEAEKYIPFDINDVITDATVLPGDSDEKGQMRVLLAAAKKNVVESRVNMFKGLGFSVSAIDIDSFACFNAFCHATETLDSSKSMALLNMGYTHTNVVISMGSNPFFTRDIQIGAGDLVKAVAKSLGTGEKESEKLIIDPKEKSAEVLDAAKSALANLVDELRLSFGYYENQHGKSVGEIYVSGGVAGLKGVRGYLEESFGVKPVSWNPFAKFEIDPSIDTKSLERVRSQFAVCAGIAISD